MMRGVYFLALFIFGCFSVEKVSVDSRQVTYLESEVAKSELKRILLWHPNNVPAGKEWCYTLNPQLYPDIIYRIAVTGCSETVDFPLDCTFHGSAVPSLGSETHNDNVKTYESCLQIDKTQYDGCIRDILKGIDAQRIKECTLDKEIPRQVLRDCKVLGNGHPDYNPRTDPYYSKVCFTKKVN